MGKTKKPKGFSKAEKKTTKLFENREKLKVVLEDAYKKSIKNKKKLSSVWIDFQTLLRLIKAYFKKEYKDLPWKTLIYATTAVVYFLNPFDVIPDFIPLTGYLDDITLITFVIKSIQKDLEKFASWEKNQIKPED